MSSRNPAYRVVTDRLVIRCWQPADLPLLQSAIAASLAHLRPWMPWAHDEPKPDAEKLQFIRRARANFDRDADYIYGIFDRDETSVLGGSGLHTRRGAGTREIGYWIHTDHTGRGLATECTAALTQVAFEVDAVHRIEVRCDPDNHPSAAIPEKLGFTHEGTLRKAGVDIDGQPRDTMIWGLTDSGYPDSPAYRAPVDAYDSLGQQLLAQ